MSKFYVGIDIGSTASKTVILDEEKVIDSFTLPTGWNGREIAENIIKFLKNVDIQKICGVLQQVTEEFAWVMRIKW